MPLSVSTRRQQGPLPAATLFAAMAPPQAKDEVRHSASPDIESLVVNDEHQVRVRNAPGLRQSHRTSTTAEHRQETGDQLQGKLERFKSIMLGLRCVILWRRCSLCVCWCEWLGLCPPGQSSNEHRAVAQHVDLSFPSAAPPPTEGVANTHTIRFSPLSCFVRSLRCCSRYDRRTAGPGAFPGAHRNSQISK